MNERRLMMNIFTNIHDSISVFIPRRLFITLVSEELYWVVRIGETGRKRNKTKFNWNDEKSKEIKFYENYVRWMGKNGWMSSWRMIGSYNDSINSLVLLSSLILFFSRSSRLGSGFSSGSGITIDLRKSKFRMLLVSPRLGEEVHGERDDHDAGHQTTQ